MLGANTTRIARIRAEFEETAEIPWVEFLQTEDRRTIQRHRKAEEEQPVEAAPEAENQPSTSPDLSLEDDEEEREEAVEGSKRPDRNANGVQSSNSADGEFESAWGRRANQSNPKTGSSRQTTFS